MLFRSIRAGRFDGSGEGLAMPFITEADLAALARYPLSLQQAARAIWATAELRTPFGPAHRSEALIQRRSEEHTSELQSLMRISYAVFCLKTQTRSPSPYVWSQHSYPHLRDTEAV